MSATHPIITRSLPRSAEDPAALTLDGAKRTRARQRCHDDNRKTKNQDHKKGSFFPSLSPGIHSVDKPDANPPGPPFPRGPCPEPTRVIDADKKAIEWASSGYQAIPLFGRRGQIRSNGRCDVGWKGYPSWEAGLLDGGEAGKRCELGELGEATFRPRTKWGWRRAKTQKGRDYGLAEKYCTLWYFVHYDKQYIRLA